MRAQRPLELLLMAVVATACTVDEDCSLNGVCGTGGMCACDSGWTGPDCGVLWTIPGPRASGYNANNVCVCEQLQWFLRGKLSCPPPHTLFAQL